MKDPIKQVEPHQTIKRNDSVVEDNIAKTFAKLQGMCLVVDFVTLRVCLLFTVSFKSFVVVVESLFLNSSSILSPSHNLFLLLGSYSLSQPILFISVLIMDGGRLGRGIWFIMLLLHTIKKRDNALLLAGLGIRHLAQND